MSNDVNFLLLSPGVLTLPAAAEGLTWLPLVVLRNYAAQVLLDFLAFYTQSMTEY